MPSHVTKRHSLQSNSNGTGNGGGNGEEFEDGVGIEPEILGLKKGGAGLGSIYGRSLSYLFSYGWDDSRPSR